LIPGTNTPVPAFSTHLASMTGMFFDGGRIYYTVSGNPRLYYRYFTPESLVVARTSSWPARPDPSTGRTSAG
jgi:hypothetical protein